MDDDAIFGRQVTLGTKIAAAISLVFALVLAGAATALILDERDFVEEELDIHGRLLGHVVANAARETMAARGQDQAHQLVRSIDQREARISIRWLDLVPTGTDAASSLLTPDDVDRLRDGRVVGRISPRDEDTFHTFVPVASNGSTLSIIQIAESLEARNAHVASMLQRIIGGAAIGLLLGAVVAYVLGRRLVGRPVAELVRVARFVGEGDFSQRADEGRRDELGTLAREMNDMTAKLGDARKLAEELEVARRGMEAQVRHADRLATLGRLASGVAHEVGTPLQSITIRAELIREKAGHLDGVEESVRAITRQSGRVATIVRDLLHFARKQTSRRSSCDLGTVVEHAVALVKAARPNPQIEIEQHLGCDDRTATADGDQIEQVLTNLILNGIHAMPDGGKVTVGLEQARALPPPDVEPSAERYLCLYVEDQGTGIPDDVLPHVFDPFFTTKGVDEGTGLGLSIAYGIVREHAGWMDVETEQGRGTRFSVYLPCEKNTGGRPEDSPAA